MLYLIQEKVTSYSINTNTAQRNKTTQSKEQSSEASYKINGDLTHVCSDIKTVSIPELTSTASLINEVSGERLSVIASTT